MEDAATAAKISWRHAELEQEGLSAEEMEDLLAEMVADPNADDDNGDKGDT
jgi:hypothetical protein